MSNVETVVIGTIGRPWGIKGQFLVDPRGSDPARLISRGRLRVRGGSQEGDREFPILASHFAGGRLVLQVEGCATPEEAEGLRGAQVVVPTEELGAAPEGSFYPHELSGLKAVTTDGRRLGIVEKLLPTAGADLLQIRAEGREILVPFVEDICRVDLEAGEIAIDPPEGLLELD